MRRLLLGAAIVFLATCASAPPDITDPAPPDPVYGPEVDGLALAAEAPVSAARGDTLAVELRIRVTGPADAGVPMLDVRPPDYFARLRMRPEGGGEGVVVEPTDPTAGLPDPPPPPGEPATRPIRSDEVLGTVRFPLASRWDRITTGRWHCTVEFTHEGVVHRNPVEGSFRGRLVSQPFDLVVTSPPERWLEVRVPPTLLGGEVTGTLRLPVRNGFAVGLSTINGRTGAGPDGRPFDEEIRHIAASRGRPKFTIFETSYLPEHRWHPGPGTGHYRVLWEVR